MLDDCSPDAAWSATVREQCEASGVGYYRSPRNMGIPRNMNLALLHAADAGYDYVAITNSDVVFPSNLVSSMVSTAASDPSIASVTAWSNHVSSFSLENVGPRRRSAREPVSTACRGCSNVISAVAPSTSLSGWGSAC